MAGLRGLLERMRGVMLCAMLAAASFALAGSVPSAAQTSNTSDVPLSVLNRLTPEEMQQLLNQQNNGKSQVIQPTVMPQQSVLVPLGAPPRPQEHSKLESIMSERAGTPLVQFGYDQLANGQLVSAAQVGAVQDSYVLGTGDQLDVVLRGQENSEFTVTVDRDGQVTLPKLAPIGAAGLSFGDFRQRLEDAVRRAYISTKAYVTLAQARQISVLVVGNVRNPGQQTLTGLSTVLDALNLAGGVTKSGSLRDITVVRGGNVIHVDLYDFVAAHNAAPDLTIAQGDRIIVPALGPTVAIAGAVRRPAIYELPPGNKAISEHALLALGNGPELPGAYRQMVLKIRHDGKQELVDETGKPGALVRDGEILFVQPAVNYAAGKVMLRGPVRTPGLYSLDKAASLHDLLPSADVFKSTPYMLLGIISRLDPQTQQRVAIPFSPAEVIAGKANTRLMSNDIVEVFTVSQMRALVMQGRLLANRNNGDVTASDNNFGTPQYGPGGQPYYPNGAVPGALQPGYANQATQQNGAQNQTGTGPASPQYGYGQVPPQYAIRSPYNTYNQQLTPEQEAAQAAMQGQGVAIYNPQQAGQQPLQQNPAQGPLQGQTQGQPNTPALQPGASLYPNPYLNQNLNQQTPNPAAPFSEPYQPNAPGQQISNPYEDISTAATLADFQSGDLLARSLYDYRVTLSGAVREPGLYLTAPGTTLAELLAASGGLDTDADTSGFEITSTEIDNRTGQSTTHRRTVRVAPSEYSGVTLRMLDNVDFHHVFTDRLAGSVTVRGEVRYPGTYSLLRGERLSEVLVRAGGLTDVAYPYGTVFLRQSLAHKEEAAHQRLALEMERQFYQEYAKKAETPVNYGGGTMGVSGAQSFIDKIKNEPALGRMTVIADPTALAANPQKDPMLQPGDSIYIPPRPSTVMVIGAVMQPGNYAFSATDNVSDYISQAGGYDDGAKEGMTFVVYPDGTARRVDESWLHFNSASIPPGSVIYVPRDLFPFNWQALATTVTALFQNLAVSAASIAVIARGN